MQQNEPRPTAIVSVCAPADLQGLERWEVHLRPLEQAGIISAWSVRHLQAGLDRETTLHHHLDRADLIVLLLSADFFADDECVALMEHALVRHQQDTVQIIPLLLRPVAWRETKLAPFIPLPSDGHAVTLWKNPEAALDDCVREIRHILGRPITAPLTRRKRASVEEQNREWLLHRVHSFWITGVLEQSLHGAVLMALGLQEQPDAVANPWQLLIQESEQTNTPLPAGTRMTEVYDAADGELLILGEPGAGKTTLLLELARDLLNRAEQTSTLPMPVVFNLSSWTRKRQSLALWLREELETKYQVPKKVGSDWVNTDQILPLLDGLDEVDPNYRTACMQAINEYRQTHSLVPLVVCCRVNEYMSQANRLTLYRAVIIQPLTTQQINTYLAQAGEQLASLCIAFQKDPVLQELATTPLMLTILILTYQGAPLEKIKGDGSAPIRQRQIFALYIQRMLLRRKAKSPYTPQQIIHWLHYLAQQMQRQNQTVFYIEQMQSSWLPKKWQQFVYRALAGGISGGLLGGLIGFEVGDMSFGLSPLVTSATFAISIIGLIVGLSLGLGSPKSTEVRTAEVITWSWTNACLAAIASIIGETFGLLLIFGNTYFIYDYVFSLIDGLIYNLFSENSLLVMIVEGCIGWTIISLNLLLIEILIFVILSVFVHKKLNRDRLILSKPRVWSTVRRGAVVGTYMVCVGFVLLEITNLMAIELVGRRGIGFDIYLIVLGCVSGLITGLISGVSSGQLEKQESFKPNQGIWRSLYNSGRVLLCVVFIVCIIYILLFMVDYIQKASQISISEAINRILLFCTLFGLPVGLFFGLLNGGITCIKHLLLRIFLWRGRVLPWRCARFFDYAAERILLRKVGGGYIFVHRLLMDYLADLPTSPTPTSATHSPVSSDSPSANNPSA